MSHFAKIENNIVTQVMVTDQDFIDSISNENDLWIQTSYNTSGGTHNNGGTALRGNYAGIGYTWDEDDNIFWPKRPHASWVKHNESASWKSPIGDAPALTEEQTSQNEANTHSWSYVWNEANTTWDLADSKA